MFKQMRDSYKPMLVADKMQVLMDGKILTSSEVKIIMSNTPNALSKYFEGLRKDKKANDYIIAGSVLTGCGLIPFGLPVLIIGLTREKEKSYKCIEEAVKLYNNGDK